MPGLTKAQAPDWTRVLQLSTYGTQNFDYVTADANYSYMAASISGQVTFNGTDYTSVGLRDMIISKIDFNGTVIWTKQINAQSNGSIYADVIKVDGTGSIYVSGVFSGQTTIGTSTITSGTLYNAFIAKFDSDGNGIWATPFFYLGTGSSKIALDGSGNIFLINKSRKLLKFNSLGEIQFEQTYSDRTLQAIAVSGSNLFIGGALPAGTTNFGSIPLTSLGGYYTGYLVRADLNGIFNQSVIVGGSTSGDGSAVSDITLDNSGNLIITGGYTFNLVLGGISITNPSQSYYTYIAKCNTNFDFTWASSSSSFSNPSREMWTYRIFTDNLNNIYEYGLISSSFSYGSVPVNPEGGQFLVKFDPDGNATDSYALQNSSVNRTFVAPAGKILRGVSDNSSTAVSYGNFYLTQYSNNLAQDWQLNSTANLSGTARINYIKHDASGNTYLQSRVFGYCDYFGHILNINTNVQIISKHDLSGNLLWMRLISDIGTSIFGTSFTLDKDNNVLTTGFFQNYLNIGTTILTTSNINPEGYVAKYSTDGEFLWAAKMNLGQDISQDGYISVTTDNAGNVLVSGPLDPANFLVKFNASGNRLWTKVFPMESYYFSLVSADANNNIYLTSEIHLSDHSGSTMIGSIPLTQTHDDGATVLVKFDPDGNALWAKTYGGVTGASVSDGWPCDIKTDAAGNTYLWGWCRNNSVFGATTLVNPFPVNQDYSYFLAKINTSGDVVWAKAVYEARYGFNYGDLLDLDNAGNVYVGGHFRDKINIDGSEFTPEVTYDFFTAKFSNSGSFQWIKTIPSNAIIISALDARYDNNLSVAGLAGKDPVLGGVVIERKGGSSNIVATLGNLNAVSHFVPVWWPGNGTDHMNLYAMTATLDGTPLQPGDEIGIFDGNVCVGTGTLTQVLTGSVFLSMVASHDDPDTPSKDGFSSENPITFRIWDSSAGREVTGVQASYRSGTGFFSPGATSSFDLTASATAQQEINLTAGWNILSFAVEPMDLLMQAIVNPLIISDVLVKVQDEKGNALERLSDPIGWINEIGQMSVTEGYKIRVISNTSLNLSGQPVMLPLDIPLGTGWNIIGYPSLNPQSAYAAFSSLIASGALVKVQNEQGASIEQLEGSWIYGFETLIPGEGYKVKTNMGATFTLTGGAKGEIVSGEKDRKQTEHFKPAYTGNGVDHMNIFLRLGEWEKSGLGDGYEIGVFDGDICVGAAIVVKDSKYIQIIASFDDPETDIKDGFTEGNELGLKIWNRATGAESGFRSIQPEKGYSTTFEKLGTTVLKAELEGEQTSWLGDAYPNPSKDLTTFTFKVAGKAGVRLEIFDVMGNSVKVLVDETLDDGYYQKEWDNMASKGNRVKAGIYFYRLSLNGLSQIKQLVIQ